MATKKPMDYLNEAAVAISYCDTNGNLLTTSLHDNLKQAEQLYQSRPDIGTLVNNLFQHLQANTKEEKENFIAALSASLRMFPEQNAVRSGDNRLTRGEVAELVHNMDAARTTEWSKLKTNGYTKCMNIFLNTIEMSQAFAKSQKFENFSDMANHVRAPNLFQSIKQTETGWEKYSAKLPLLNDFWKSLNTLQQDQLASTLFHIAAKQEGVKLIQANPEVQRLLAQGKKFHPAVASARLFHPAEPNKQDVTPVITPASHKTK